MKKLLLTLATTAIVGLSITPALAVDSLNAAFWIPGNHQYSRYLLTYFAERVAKRSDGKFTINVDVGSTIVTPRGAMAELADGITDMSAHAGVYTPTDLPVSMAIGELGMLYDDPRLVIATVSEFNLLDPAMQAEWQKNGIVYGAPYTTNGYKLICNKKVSTLEEFKGAQIRMPGRAPSAWVNSAGGVTAAFNSNEQYGALDKGALTCTTTTVADAVARKLHEVATHVTDLPITIFWEGYGIAYNQAKWNELTPEQRKMLHYAQADAVAALIISGTLQEEQEARIKYAAAGGQFHEPGAGLAKSLADFRAGQVDAAIPIAKEKFGVENAPEIYARFKSTMAKWKVLLADVPVDDVEGLANLLRTEIYDKIDYSTYGVK